MNEKPLLVTTCNFKGNQFLVKMNAERGNSLDLSVIDKYSGEEWSAKYDYKFIENLTQKTGNYKRFDIFITMLKSGLLRTSDCVSLDLLTFEDLELLRNRRFDKNKRKISSSHSSTSSMTHCNRRYLILTYTVEFDRIHYPLPMEYVGPPNPRVLQATIRQLEAEVQKLQSRLNDKNEESDVVLWKNRVKQVETEKWILEEEVTQLRQLLTKQTGMSNSKDNSYRRPGNIPVALRSLEEQVERERESFKATLLGLQEQNHRLRQELDSLQCIHMHCQKSEPLNVIWKQRGHSPTVRNKQNFPRRSEHFSPDSPLRLGMKRMSRKKPSTQGRNSLTNATLLKPTASDRLNNKDHIHTWERGPFSDSSIHSRARSPVGEKPRYCSGDAKYVSGNAHQRYSIGHGCRMSSPSSDSSGRLRRLNSKKGKDSSRLSICSTTSSSTTSSTSRINLKQRRNVPGRKHSRTIPSPSQQNTKGPIQKNYLNSSKKGSTPRMSDLETRIKALQNLLKEGLSLP